MSKSAKTPLDRKLTVMVIVPFIALAAFLAAAGAEWRVQSQRIRPLLLESLPESLVDAPSPIAADYAARTDSALTAQLRELIHAVSMVNRKYDMLGSILQDDEEWLEDRDTARPVDKYVADYLAEAQPLLEEVRSMDVDFRSIWLPNELGNPNYWSQDENLLQSVVEMLYIDFQDAVRSGDGARALEDYAASLRIAPRPGYRFEIDPLIPATIGTGLWDSDQLEQLDRLIIAGSDLNDVWQSDIRYELIRQAPALLTGRTPRNYWSDPIEIVVAPSRRMEWLKRYRLYSDLNGIGTRKADRLAMKIETESLAQADRHLDLSLQFPLYVQNFRSGDGMAYRTRTSVRARNQTRFARTAIAIAKYKLKFDVYPPTLSELAKVGFPNEESYDPLGQSFYFENDDKGVRLGNASGWFPRRAGSIRSSENRQMILATYLQEYEDVKFE